MHTFRRFSVLVLVLNMSCGEQVVVRETQANCGNGSVAAVRQGQLNEGTARVVLDLAGPATLGTPQIAADGKSLSFALQPVSEARFLAEMGKGRDISSTRLGKYEAAFEEFLRSSENTVRGERLRAGKETASLDF